MDKGRKEKMNKKRKDYKMKISSIAISILLAIGLLFFIFSFGWIDVRPTQVAVEINKVAGKISEMPKGVGYHFFNRWVTDMVIYNVNARAFPSDTTGSEESKKYNLELKTNDGQNVSVDLTVIYALKGNEVPLLHQTVGPNYEDQILLPQIRSEARIAIGGYSAEELYQGKVRDVIQAGIKDKLTDVLSRYPAIQIQDALIRHFAFSPTFERAIEDKKLAAQTVEINKNLAFAQEEMAKKQEAEARGEKLKVIQAAEGEAQAKKVNADAERYRLEQDAAGSLAKYKAEAEGKRLLTEALGGGQNVVALAFAERIPDKLQIYAYPVGQQSTSIMDVSGIFGEMFKKK